MRRIGIIILAAGSSSRLGRPKQLLSFQGQSLIQRAACAAVASICQPIIVVVGAHAESIRKETEHLPVTFAHHPHWELGMGSSIKSGLDAMAAIDAAQASPTEAALLMVSDQPFITPALLNHLAYSYFLHGGIIASAYDETLGVPAVFGKDFHQELISLEPSQGAKLLIQRHRPRVHSVSFPEGSIDIDTPQDYEMLAGKKYEAAMRQRESLLRNAYQAPGLCRETQ